ncbi:MAG: ABC transporter substrate-binding protein [Lentimicrobiaceae bacterium]|jgi:ABC-type branched-subunit amino acid transport system substrate-binding protein|nr:ABC transporter substrate-binding protein [Lentimicrobiaceae bacterium]MCP4910575.1 amino acid ABC transporter substrate-binding protein [Bacteroidota bacterium]MBT3454671.1 ABC transporter substrate-binding protein [Lentimicrobiaceae bacterium]MBT3819724.1 ABC transporter substrate-binding protein [Lentimicrobiaceae bacterium]MBT4061197.1 ABC transporter substrate-binding protein [Lentimicrobiaceae bacterium]
MKTNNLLTVLLLLSVLFLSQIGCNKNDDSNNNEKYFTLGVILPMDLEDGTLSENSLRTAIDEINNAGGVGDGYEIRLDVKSSEGSDRQISAALAANNIIDESENLIGFVSSFSSSTLGINEIVIPELYPVIAGSATDGSLSNVSPYFQRLCSPNSFEANVLTQQAAEYGISSIAIAFEKGEPYSEDLATAFADSYESEIPAIVEFSQGDPNLESKINELLESNPEGIFISMLNPDVYSEFFTALNNMNNNNLLEQTSFLLSDGFAGNEFFTLPIDYLLGDINGHPRNFGATPSADTSSTEYKYFREELLLKYNHDVGPFNAQFYDLGYIYALSIQKSFQDVDMITIAAFRELVANNIRPVSDAISGDEIVKPSQGWESMKASAQTFNIDYIGASGNCNIDSQGNTVTPYEVFRVVKQDGVYSFETIKIIP